MKGTIAACILFALFAAVSCQGTVQGGACRRAATCSDCIKTSAQCAWCSKPDMGAASRCDEIIAFKGRTCPDKFLFFPRNQRNNTLNLELSAPGAKVENIIQLKPQRVALKLRPKSSYPLLLKFKQAEDYPVDLYYLMDLSNSMKDDKKKLAELGNLFAEEMGKITSNFKLGFGSFVDKVVMPYTNTVPEKLKRPCDKCEAPYGFRNHMALSLNTSRFAEEVNRAPVSGNLDGPEGGFDAIMQAIVCNDIGWRKKSRKLLVFSTDSSFHSAGDGKIGGIVKPNDGECYLDKQGYYYQSSYQDYPSLSQINQKAQGNKVNIIFAVTANQKHIYENVGHQIEGATSGVLSNDSSNVVGLVREQYDKITSTVEFKDTAPDFIEVSYFSKCLGKSKVPTSKCGGLKFGGEVEFEVDIKVLRCPENKSDYKINFTIYAIPLPSMTVDLEVVCECDCEKPDQEERNSSICNYNGTYQCGVCECYGNRNGRYCECDRETSSFSNNTECYHGNDSFVCSRRGKCVCGVCECEKHEGRVYEGKQCECDNFSCERYGGEMCSGPENGYCLCGRCECLNNRRGYACECPPSDKVCYEAGSELECEGRGKCGCDQCLCNSYDGIRPYSGKFCQIHPDLLQTCPDFYNCVECVVYKNGPLYSDDELCNNCTDRMIIIKKEVVNVENDTVLCFKSDDNDCKFRFVYYFNGTTPVIYAQETKECPERDMLIVIVIGVIVGIVLIGLALLLIWKLLTTIHDRREFAKFEKEAQSAKWDTGVNPLFKGATSTFKNPTYGGK